MAEEKREETRWKKGWPYRAGLFLFQGKDGTCNEGAYRLGHFLPG